MKKCLVTILTLVLCMMSLSTAMAEETDTIEVYLDQQLISFDVLPEIKKGTTLVPFRPIFEALGLEVTYDKTSDTVKGSNDEVQIEFIIGEEQAVVNGKLQPLSQPSQLVDGRTLVPLRFVGEASGKEVVWDAKTRTIHIHSKSSPEELKQSVIDFLDYQAELERLKDVEGFMATIHPESPYYDVFSQVVPESFETYDLKTVYEMIDIISINDTEANVQVISTSENEGEAFYLSNRSEVVFTLLKSEEDTWTIYDIQTVKLEYTEPMEFYQQEADVSSELKAELKSVLERMHESVETGDLEGVLSTIEETSPAYEQSKQIYEFLLNTYKLVADLKEFTVLEASELEAHVYAVEETRKVEGPADMQDVSVKSVHTLRKNEAGEWKIFKTQIISTEIVTAEDETSS